MTEESGLDCETLRDHIATLQKEFEGMWLKVSAGTAPSSRYRELRHEIDQLRAKYTAECGHLVEESSLPRKITADWRAG